MTKYGVEFDTMVYFLLFCPLYAVNGLAMSVASLFKAVGPSISGALFSWSLTNGNVQEMKTEFICFVVVSVCVSCVFGTMQDSAFHWIFGLFSRWLRHWLHFVA